MIESGDRRMPGRDLGDAFRFASDDPAVEAAFIAAFGSLTVTKPIPCLLAGAAVDDAWHTERAVWGQTGLVRSCDGEHQTAWRNAEGYIERGEQPCMAPQCYVQKARQDDGSYKDEWRQCPASGRLDLVLPALTEAGFYGVVRLGTHGEIDVRVIDAALRRLTVMPWAQVVHDAGGLYNVPFEIFREQTEISYVQKGTKRTRTLGVVTLRQTALRAPALAAPERHEEPLALTDDDEAIDGLYEEQEDTNTTMDEGGCLDKMMNYETGIHELSSLIVLARGVNWISAATLGSERLVTMVRDALPKIRMPETCKALQGALEAALEGTPGLDEVNNDLTTKHGELVLNTL